MRLRGAFAAACAAALETECLIRFDSHKNKILSASKSLDLGWISNGIDNVVPVLLQAFQHAFRKHPAAEFCTQFIPRLHQDRARDLSTLATDFLPKFVRQTVVLEPPLL